MRCPVVVGRESEIQALREMVDVVRGGRGAAAVAVGEAGVGKTRLGQLLSSMAAASGLRVAVGRAMPDRVATPLRPIEEVLLDLAREIPVPDDPRVTPFLPVLSALVPQWRVPGWGPPNESPLVTAEGIFRLLRTLENGWIVVLEDLHWADQASIAVVRFLMERIGGVRLGLLGTLRTGEGAEGLASTLEAAGARLLSLGRLTLDESLDMASACLGESGDPEAIERVAREADGLPLLIEDLLTAGEVGAGPERFAATVRHRLGRMTPDERRVLSSAAVLGRHFDWSLLAAVAGLPSDVTAQALHRAGALQLVVAEGGGFAFRHALTREVVLSDTDPAARQALSLAAAAVVQDDHLAARLLVDAGEPDRAARRLLEGGRRGMGDGSLAEATAALEAAAKLVAPGSEVGMDIGAALAQALLVGGRPQEAEAVASCYSSAPMGLLRSRAAVALAQWDEAAAHLQRVATSFGLGPELEAEIAVLEVQVELGRGLLPGPLGESCAHAAAQRAREAGRPDLECDALEAAGLWARLRDLDAAATFLDQALRLAQAPGLGPRFLRVLNELGMVEMLRDARGDRLEQARAQALRTGALGVAASIGVNLAALLVMTSRYEEALAVAAEVESLAAGLGIPPLQAAAHLMQGFAYAHQGRRQLMDRHLSSAEALAPMDADLRTGAWAIGRAVNALVDEDRMAARRALDRARAEAPQQLIRVPNTFEGPELLLRAVGGEPVLAEAEASTATLVRGARYVALWHGCALAVARGAVGDAAGATAALATALDAGHRYPLFSALAMRLVAEAALRDGWGDPVALLRPAAATFAQLGLPRPAAATRGLLVAAGQAAPRRRRGDPSVPPPLASAGVTPREAEVLGMLADRLSNREIAQRLYLSTRTVEKHVAALLQKLQAQDRAALGEVARSLP